MPYTPRREGAIEDSLSALIPASSSTVFDEPPNWKQLSRKELLAATMPKPFNLAGGPPLGAEPSVPGLREPDADAGLMPVQFEPVPPGLQDSRDSEGPRPESGATPRGKLKELDLPDPAIQQ